MSPSAKYRRKLRSGDAPPEPGAQRVWMIKPMGTLWVGLVMLLVGAMCGLAIQPLVGLPGQGSPSVTLTSTPPVEEANPATPTQDNSPRGQMMRGVIKQTRHFQGDENAPVTVIEFCDFEVPECAQFANEVYNQFKDAYIDTNLLRFGFWPMATLNESSQLAAEAAECAGDQEAFWQFYEAVFSGEANSSENFNKASLVALAKSLDLDTETFTECLDSGKYADVVKEGTTTIQNLGLPQVPTFLINGQALVGFQSFESLKQTIDGMLAGQ